MLEHQSTVLARFDDTAGTAQVVVSGELDIANASEFKETLLGAIDRGFKILTADLTRTLYIDSTAIGALVACNRRLAEVQGEFRMIVDPNGQVLRILRLVGLDKVFAIES